MSGLTACAVHDLVRGEGATSRNMSDGRPHTPPMYTCMLRNVPDEPAVTPTALETERLINPPPSDCIRKRTHNFSRKAFDSIDHDFIFKVLEKIGMPHWVINTIKGLMHDIRVFTTLKNPEKKAIFIKRGVKQGCPLSPYLFTIVMTVKVTF